MNQYSKDITILAIESSCDDASASIIRNKTILSNETAGQKIHEEFGGVVPELASRAHQQNIIPVVEAAIKHAKIDKSDLDAVAFTKGPGLMGSLLVGVSFAKSFAQALSIPMIDVNHMKAHVLAHMIEENNQKNPDFPFLCLTVSGGHTQIVLVKSPLDMTVIGSTIDDAAGEAFDKAAKILGLPYPGGPLVDKHAKNGDPLKYEFPKPRVEGLNMSFSGLKTSFLYFTQNNPEAVENHFDDVCASIQHTIVSYTLGKLKKAAKEHNITQLAIAGGVSANSYIRTKLTEMCEKHGWQAFIPPFQYCTDNAGMIAITAYYQYLEQDFCDLNVKASPRLAIS